MPLLAGGYLGDASANNVQDASANNVGEPSIHVVVTYGGFLLAEPEAGIWDELNTFLHKLQNAIELGEYFVSTAVLANITNGIASIIEKVDAVQATGNTSNQRLAAITDDGLNDLQAILDAIAAIVPGGGLTTEEHDHLVALLNVDYDQIAGDVWGFTIPFPNMMDYDGGPMAQTMLTHMAYYLQFLNGYEGLPVPDRPHFRYCTLDMWSGTQWLGYWTNTAVSTWVPILDLALVEDGDTVWAFLTREYSGYAWTQAGPGSWPTGGSVWIVQDAGVNQAYFRCTLTDDDLRPYWPVPEGPPAEATNVAPIWPGSAGVTLGTPVTLVDQLHIVGTLDGVLVNVTTPPTKVGRRSIGGALYDYGVGEIAFETDEGDIEPWQYLGFRTGIFVPKTMQQAAGARLRVLAGASGTVTPWTRT
jgi:hypothetical protein